MKKIIIPPVFVLVFLILIVISYFLIPEYNLLPFPFNLLGVIISFLGFVIMGKARDLFKKNQTTLDIEKSTFLIDEGVFSKTRNPMYIGMFLLLLGIGICFMNIISILLPFLFIISIHFVFVLKEEKLMTEVFGQEYIHYKEKVKRWI
ncbi:MAG: isoprenylcysteine carboxylmethyltransferase family protein [Bacteroidales bacterium]|nr:isoprenylcysteine carboxylmethyltransferase family protein [Bacteroidales bacterium]